VTVKFIAQELISPTNIPKAPTDSNALNHFLTVLFTIVGAIALLMLVIAGFRLVTSAGDTQKTAEIRRQIAYIAAGLILAATADIIVTFVLKKAT
jgi:uncharacterized membrane protein